MNIALYFDTTTIICGAAVILLAVLSSLMNPFFRFLPSHGEKKGPEEVDDNSFKITKEDEGYYLVEAKWFPKVLKGIDVTDYEALQYMQRVLEKSGVFDALREEGIQEGDIVSLYDIEFEYIP